MNRIEISKDYIVTGAEYSSVGNQLKWKQDAYWYKADRLGFESLAETVVSRLVQHSNIEEFVNYEPVMIDYKGNTYRGCRSENFKKETEEIVSLESLSKKCTGFGLSEMLERIADVKERILYTVELVENVTGLEDFGVYLTKILELDAFFMNVGRRTDNICLLYDIEGQKYRFCPVFDMGDSFFSDTKYTCPLVKSMVECYHVIKAEPFSHSFEEQVKAAQAIYDSQLKFTISEHEMINIVRDMINGMRGNVNYQAGENRRIGEILRYQTKAYQSFFRR
ncbi:MAG: hypothetical protein NC231_14505 [Bacillus sp. (in: Bacteria)]|nr:hypothetical protein [Bacillus sp. (in: firmicutes)]MCM1427979.1 hypothetical protein [Eubacterium sp.]